LLAVIRDISERKQAEDIRRRAYENWNSCGRAHCRIAVGQRALKSRSAGAPRRSSAGCDLALTSAARWGCRRPAVMPETAITIRAWTAGVYGRSLPET
jgi:hypothetical protein